MSDAVVVVVRYFGGTRLGVGGLIRAYGEAATAALASAPRREGRRAVRIRLRYGYAHTAAVMRVLDAAAASGTAHGFDEASGMAEISTVVPRDALPMLREQLGELTAGDVAPEIGSETTLFRAVRSSA